MAALEQVILVDAQDNQIGIGEKLETHRQGLLHRAFSVFIVNPKNEMLIQQRALNKYHCPGLWANTCCGHPRPGERTEQAAHRRLQEEMGFDCAFVKKLDYIYKVAFENRLQEHEFLHVFVGTADVQPVPHAQEVADWRWLPVADIQQDSVVHPEKYAYWFKLSMKKLYL